MILIDANLLLYANIRDFPQHERARPWLEARFAEPARVGLPWASLLAWLRIATNPKVFPRPLPPIEAWARIRGWLALPNVWIPSPTERHAEILGVLIERVAPAAGDVPDADLAALAIEHNLTLCSSDRGFSRFPGLRWHDPLTTGKAD